MTGNRDTHGIQVEDTVRLHSESLLRRVGHTGKTRASQVLGENDDERDCPADQSNTIVRPRDMNQ